MYSYTKIGGFICFSMHGLIGAFTSDAFVCNALSPQLKLPRPIPQNSMESYLLKYIKDLL